MRGVNGQTIFEEEYDYIKCLQCFNKSIEKYSCELYAYCLMSNHIHLLFRGDIKTLGCIIKSFGSRFVSWYNAKYDRTGHLFQNRFYSQAVHSKDHFLRSVRYIHNNPVKAALVSNPNDYPFSSSRYYFNLKKENNITVNASFASFLFDSPDDLYSFLLEPNDDPGFECPEPRHRIPEETAKQLILKVSGCKNLQKFPGLPPEKKTECILKLLDEGLSIRQIAMHAGVSKSLIEKVKKRRS